MQEEIRSTMAKTIGDLGYPEVDFSVDLPKDIRHGDFSTNVALMLSKRVGASPRDIAERILEEWRSLETPSFSAVEIAGAGFINFRLSKEFFEEEVRKDIGTFPTEFSGKKVLVEYTDPNPFKQFHIGHLMSNAIGESVARLYELGGAQVVRICYSGDIGPHVAKCIWGMRERRDAFPQDQDSLDDKVAFLGEAYVLGSNRYEDDHAAQAEIKEINRRLFEHSDPELEVYYDKGRAWSLEYFDRIYAKLGTRFDYNLFESQSAPVGERIVRDNVENGVFTVSDEGGAVVYEGERDGLHTRVFINSQGLPTYEAKDLGNARLKEETVGSFDRSIVVTASEQADYFRVILAAMARAMPGSAARTFHVSHGMLQLSEGKMSSRKGNVVTGDSLITQVESKVAAKIEDRELSDDERADIVSAVSVGALKYSILKQTPGKNIVFDFDKSISFEGDSGPYLQYAYIRAQSLLAKAGEYNVFAKNAADAYDIERLLVRFGPVAVRALGETAPQLVASYLIELAGEFNSWYAAERIIGDDNQDYKLLVVRKVAQTLKAGLQALGIRVPAKM